MPDEHHKEASVLRDNRRRYEGKVVLVTGGGSGLGRARSLSFGREGGRIAVVDIDGAAAAQTAKSAGDARAYTCDVDDEAAVTAAFRAVDVDLGPLDVLVNNAGIGAGRPEAGQHALAELRNLMVGTPGDSLRTTSTLGLAEFRRTLSAHVYGTFLCAKEALRRMDDRRSGAILNMASVAGILGLPGSIDYAAAKGAIIAMTKSLAQEVVGAGIRVNAIAPGLIDTPLLSRRSLPNCYRSCSRASVCAGSAARMRWLPSPCTCVPTSELHRGPGRLAQWWCGHVARQRRRPTQPLARPGDGCAGGSRTACCRVS